MVRFHVLLPDIRLGQLEERRKEAETYACMCGGFATPPGTLRKKKNKICVQSPGAL